MSKLKTKVEKTEGNIAHIEITVDAKEAKNAYDKAFKKMSQSVNIAGFRKGKAPAAAVEKYVGVENIKAEVLNELYNDNIAKIVQENDLDFADQPSIEKFDYEIGKEFNFTLKVELKPEVELSNFKGNTIEYEEFKQDEDTLNKELLALQERFSALVDVKDRNVNAKDTVVFDFEGFLNNEPFEHGKAEKYTLDLANSNFIPGFAEGLIGHGVGEEFTIDVKFPEDYHSENLRGQPVQFKIKIHEIKEKLLAELNDELAKKAGKFDNLEDLKADIKKYLEDTQKAENDRRKADAVFEEIIKNAKIDIQQPMILREVKAIRNESMQRAAQQGVEWEKLVEAEGGIEKIDAQLEPEAIKRIKNTLVIEKISNIEDIKIEQQDIIDQINLIAQSYGSQGHMIIEQIKNNPQSFAILTQQAATKKVTQILLENNTFKAKKAKKG